MTPSPDTHAITAPRAGLPCTLYVHLPWCVRKCPYCDFNSHAVDGRPDEAAYIDALLRDLDAEVAWEATGKIDSVFIGGGTPSLFSGAAIRRLLSGITRRVDLAADVEISLEANPGAVEADRFAAYRDAGVNRLSIGVQSLDDAHLADIGRIHSADEAVAAFAAARDAGFANINLDLMFGLPRQGVDDALRDLQAVIALQPEQVSWYQLTLEPNTLFHHRPPPLPDDDALADMTDQGEALLRENAYLQYEVSAHARHGFRCRHNLAYWRFADYVGIGAGAHGKRTGTDGVVRRRSKLRGPADYMADSAQGLAREWVVTAAELPLEFMLNALRLREGVPVALFEERTNLPLATIAAVLTEARALGLMIEDNQRLQPTPMGRRFLSNLLGLFDPERRRV